MLVKFHCKAGSLTMFGDIAVPLLRLMGMSGSVPGALLAADIPAALERLRQGVASAPADPAPERGNAGNEGDDDGPAVNLRTRAFPLVELLEAAARARCEFIWEEAGKATG